MTAPLPTLRKPKTGRPIIHFAPPPYDKALCGKPRGGEPLKPGAEVTCVVCLDLKGKR